MTESFVMLHDTERIVSHRRGFQLLLMLRDLLLLCIQTCGARAEYLRGAARTCGARAGRGSDSDSASDGGGGDDGAARISMKTGRAR